MIIRYWKHSSHDTWPGVVVTYGDHKAMYYPSWPERGTAYDREIHSPVENWVDFGKKYWTEYKPDKKDPPMDIGL